MHSWIFQWKWMNNRDVIILTFNSWTIMIWWTCEWGRYLGFLIGQNLIDPNQLKSVSLHFGIVVDVSDPKYSKSVLDQDQHKLNQSDTRNFHQWIERVMNLIALGQKLHNEYLIHQKYLLSRSQIQVKWGQRRVKPWHRWRLSLAWPLSLSKLDIWSSCFTFESSWSVESRTSSRKCFISPKVIPSQPEELKKSIKAETARTIGTLPIKPVRAFLSYNRMLMDRK